MRKRLEELNWRRQPCSIIRGDQGEVAEVFGSKPHEIVVPPISWEEQQKETA
jgi:hypothetical protein